MIATTMPFREAIASMMEVLATHRPDLLPAYLDLAANSPARFAVLELVADFGVQDARDLTQAALRVARDLDRLERRRGGWKHPREVLENPNLAGLSYFCRARIHHASGSSRRRRLEVIGRKLLRARDRDEAYAWVTDFLALRPDAGGGCEGEPENGPQGTKR